MVKLRFKIGQADFELEVYVDTGCSSGLVLTKQQLEKLNLELGEKINDEPEPCELADGTIIGADVYLSELILDKIKKLVRIMILDPTIILGRGAVRESDVLLGRGFLDDFDVVFSGIDKILTFSLEEK